MDKCTECLIEYGHGRDPDHIDFCSLHAAARELLEALDRLYTETADYITINHLGDVHHNVSMQMARAAIKQARGQA